LVGVVDDTELEYDPMPPNGAPATLDSGQVVEFETRDLFSVASQDVDYPFAFTQYMSGQVTPNLGGCIDGFGCALGDEEWVNLVAPAQYLSRYAFFVDPTYGVANIAIVRTPGTGGVFADVDIDCYGAIDDWMPIGNEGQFEVAHIDLYRGAMGACASSQQEASSAAPFGIVVWGTDYYSSYGYPAGGNVATINSVVVPAG
jgi:hypothetical protein